MGSSIEAFTAMSTKLLHPTSQQTQDVSSGIDGHRSGIPAQSQIGRQVRRQYRQGF